MHGHIGEVVQADVLPQHIRSLRDGLKGGDLGIRVTALDENREQPDIRTDIGHHRAAGEATYVIAGLKEDLLVQKSGLKSA
jgi:hypothetical protein